MDGVTVICGLCIFAVVLLTLDALCYEWVVDEYVRHHADTPLSWLGSEERKLAHIPGVPIYLWLRHFVSKSHV